MQAIQLRDPMTQRKSMFISLQRNCWVFRGTRRVESENDWGKTVGIFSLFGKWRYKSYKNLSEIGDIWEDKVGDWQTHSWGACKASHHLETPSETLTFYCRDYQTTTLRSPWWSLNITEGHYTPLSWKRMGFGVFPLGKKCVLVWKEGYREIPGGPARGTVHWTLRLPFLGSHLAKDHISSPSGMGPVTSPKAVRYVHK